MRRIAGALIGVCAYASVASAGPGDSCAVAAHLVHADAALPRVAAAIKAKNLKVVVAGTGSSTLPGANGAGTRVQGYNETSNVNVAEELVNMIQTQRAYEINSKAIQTSDQMLQKLAQM